MDLVSFIIAYTNRSSFPFSTCEIILWNPWNKVRLIISKLFSLFCYSNSAACLAEFEAKKPLICISWFNFNAIFNVSNLQAGMLTQAYALKANAMNSFLIISSPFGDLIKSYFDQLLLTSTSGSKLRCFAHVLAGCRRRLKCIFHPPLLH